MLYKRVLSCTSESVANHTGTPPEKISLIPGAQEHILKQENGKERFVQVVTELSQAFALCAGTDEAINIRDDIGFFQTVKAALAKKRGERKSTEDLDHAVRHLVAKAIGPEGEIIDVFQAAVSVFPLSFGSAAD